MLAQGNFWDPTYTLSNVLHAATKCKLQAYLRVTERAFNRQTGQCGPIKSSPSSREMENNACSRHLN